MGNLDAKPGKPGGLSTAKGKGARRSRGTRCEFIVKGQTILYGVVGSLVVSYKNMCKCLKHFLTDPWIRGPLRCHPRILGVLEVDHRAIPHEVRSLGSNMDEVSFHRVFPSQVSAGQARVGHAKLHPFPESVLGLLCVSWFVQDSVSLMLIPPWMCGFIYCSI